MDFKYTFIRGAAIIALLQIALTCNVSRSEEFINYSHVNLIQKDREICKGILLKRTVITAGHCARSMDGLTIKYISNGRDEVVVPLNIKFYQSIIEGSARDLVAMWVPSGHDADVDGSFDISSVVKLDNMLISPSAKFTLEDKNIHDSVQSDSKVHYLKSIILRHIKTFDQLVEFSELNPVRVSSPAVGPGRTGKFSLSMSSSMIIKPDDLICQGRSGSPLFSVEDGVKHLAGVLVKGKPNSYSENIICGTAAYFLRMDVGGLGWIVNQIR